MQKLLANLFLLSAKLACLWALVVFGLGITPRSWGITVTAVLATAVIGVMHKEMNQSERKR